jgi:hypothetical protein
LRPRLRSRHVGSDPASGSARSHAESCLMLKSRNLN